MNIGDYIREGKKYIIALIVLLGLSLWATLYVESPVGGDAIPMIVVVPKGATAKSVAAALAEKGLIRSELAFRFVAQATGSSSGIKPGAYKVSRAMSISEILDKLVLGDVAAVWVTIPEGYTVEQVADRLSERGLVNHAEFAALARNGAQEFSDILNIPAQGLEGYLYPETYLIPLQPDARDVARQMLETFKSKVADSLGGEITGRTPDGEEHSKPEALHRVIIVASMIEREARVAADRPLVSAVIWNRLRIGMKLDIDATVQYALGRHRSRLYYRDLEAESPYNTYTHAGLPPGPISNPGIDSIKAAIHPAEVDYFYYVARPDGSHVFSRTLDEHNAAIRRIRGGR